MTLLKLALRNLVGAGLRTVLNVLVLALAFLAIVASLGLLEGMNQQTSRAMVEAAYGGGQHWHPGYDPYDPLSLEEAHGRPPPAIQAAVERGDATPVLIVQGTMYPEGRLRPVLLKGVDPSQSVLSLPTRALAAPGGDPQEIPLLLGSRMAESTGLGVGDFVTLQWRDVEGTIDARDGRVVQVMSTPVQSVDLEQAWLPLARLQDMTGMPGEATFVVVARDAQPADASPRPTAAAASSGPSVQGDWAFQSPDDLLADIRNLVGAKRVGAAIVYALLVFLAMIAIFDTQVLALFHRKKEIGTLMALGMTRGRIMAVFVLEGTLQGLMAIVAGAVLGTPVLWRFSRVGWKLSDKADSYGYALGDTLYPVYSADVLAVTAFALLAVTAVVSWIPTRELSSVTPTEALRGRAA